MTYYNPLLAFGLKGFARTAVEAGVDGVIVRRPAARGGRAAARRGGAGRARPDPARGADLDAGACEGHRAGQPGLHLRGVAHRRHRRAHASCRPTSTQQVRDPARGDDQADLRGLRHRPRPSRRPRSAELADGVIVGSAIVRLVERARRHPRAARRRSATSSPRSRRRCGGTPDVAWFRREAGGDAGDAEEGRHRRGPVDQVRLLQGDHLPRRGRARRPRVPQVPLSVPHLRARAHRRCWPTPAPSRSTRPARQRRPAGLQGHQALPRPPEGGQAEDLDGGGGGHRRWPASASTSARPPSRRWWSRTARSPGRTTSGTTPARPRRSLEFLGRMETEARPRPPAATASSSPAPAPASSRRWSAASSSRKSSRSRPRWRGCIPTSASCPRSAART